MSSKPGRYTALSGARKSWTAMRSRCLCPSAGNYHLYGGRGISICARWDSYANFLADMGERPAGMSLGRIDSDGPYSPDNCRWETVMQQHRNRSISNRQPVCTNCHSAKPTRHERCGACASYFLWSNGVERPERLWVTVDDPCGYTAAHETHVDTLKVAS